MSKPEGVAVLLLSLVEAGLSLIYRTEEIDGGDGRVGSRGRVFRQQCEKPFRLRLGFGKAPSLQKLMGAILECQALVELAANAWHER